MSQTDTFLAVGCSRSSRFALMSLALGAYVGQEKLVRVKRERSTEADGAPLRERLLGPAVSDKHTGDWTDRSDM